MAHRSQTGEVYPRLTARRHWGRYLLGVVVETAFILGLALVAYLVAFIAMRIW